MCFTDVKKMPLGKLSKTQIAKGFEVLEELETAIKKKEKKKFDGLTSRFYTLIPHSFGRQRPPIISDLENVRKKMDMLMVSASLHNWSCLQGKSMFILKSSHIQVLAISRTLLQPVSGEFRFL